MKSLDMNATILLAVSEPIKANSYMGYLIGGIIALLILGYLIYTLLHPEKF